MALIDDLFNTGGDILDTVQEAVTTGDFSHLSNDIRDKVTTATDEYRMHMDELRTGSPQRNAPDASQRNAPGSRPNSSGNRQNKTFAGTSAFRQSYFLQTRPNKHGNLLKQIGGAIGATISGSTALLFLLVTFRLIGTYMPAAVFSGVITALLGGATWFFANMIRRGTSVQKLIERYYAYGQVIGDAEYFSIKDLAAVTGRSEKEVRKDIEDLRKESILPYAAMDRNKTTVMLTDRMYKQYQEAELARTQREEAERKRAMQNAAAKGGSWGRTGKAEQADKNVFHSSGNTEKTEEKVSHETGKTEQAKENDFQSTGNAEIDSILRDGNAYIRKIHEVNDEIPDTEIMSDKLYRLENIMRRIFAQVRKTPASAKDCRRLMNYYLPTTTKLLDAYVELYKQPEAGDNIRSSKQNIEETMDIINDAFEKLFDNMFEDKAWDISSDINVMKTMMKQDGLADEESFDEPGENGNAAAGFTDGFTEGYSDDLSQGAAAAATDKTSRNG